MLGTILGILTSITATMMAVSPLLQIKKILNHKHAGDISLLMFIVITLGTGTLAADSYYHHDLFVAIPNTFSSLLNGTTAFLIYKYTPRVKTQDYIPIDTEAPETV